MAFHNEVTFVEKRLEIICIYCLVISPSLWVGWGMGVQECQNAEQVHCNHQDHLFPPVSPFLPVAIGAVWTTTIWVHPAPYGSISLKGALENIKTRLYTFTAAPSHFPPSVLHMFMQLLLGSCTRRPLQ